MTFNAKQQAAIKRWIGRAVPLKGLFFRSVEYRYMDPIDVLSGAGARVYGGRFAPVGTRAVYMSATDSGASKEVTARKSRLGGVGQISIDKYPRVVYAIGVNLRKALSLSTLGSSQAAEMVTVSFLSRRGSRFMSLPSLTRMSKAKYTTFVPDAAFWRASKLNLP